MFEPPLCMVLVDDDDDSRGGGRYHRGRILLDVVLCRYDVSRRKLEGCSPDRYILLPPTQIKYSPETADDETASITKTDFKKVFMIEGY